MARVCGAHRQHQKFISGLMKNKEVFKGASVYVSRHSFLADSCNMLYACGCHKVPHVYRRIKVLALEIVVVHNVMHADGWGGTVH